MGTLRTILVRLHGCMEEIDANLIPFHLVPPSSSDFYFLPLVGTLIQHNYTHFEFSGVHEAHDGCERGTCLA